MTKIEFITATTSIQLRQLEGLAWAILPDFYGKIIDMSHVEYFIETLQSASVLQEKIKDGDEYYLIQNGPNALGYLGLEKRESILILSKIYLLAESRGMGIGKKAVEFTQQRALDLGLTRIELFVSEHNHLAMSFYAREGFEKLELVTHTFETGYSVRDWKYSKEVRRV